MTGEFRKKLFLVLLVFSIVFFISGCAMPQDFDLLSVDVYYETDDNRLDDIPRNAALPSEGTKRLSSDSVVVFDHNESSSYRIDSLKVMDFFNNELFEIEEFPHEMNVLINHKVIVKLKCFSDDACIEGYSCVSGECKYS